ncbi:zinc finger BED domain-containing protein RICESLEEPER 4-like [Cicer arietinum]|uniref:zinc finger BED domain-containing protein RICESLEEPER 4-like n=1 Tax=Cicer arietinum TaxID=3827 RepID=UPI00064154A4
MEQGEGNSQGGQQGVLEHHHLVDNSQPIQAAIAADELPPLPIGSKKRKPNANGPRRSSKVWLNFNILPDGPIPTAACKHCHQRYLCHSKTHGTSNLKAHSEKCKSNPANILKDPTQTNLSFGDDAHILKDPTQTNLSFGDGGSLVPSSQRFNAQACRNAIVLFVILDQHSFRVVESEGFKQLCRQLQPQMTIPSRRTIARDCFQLYLAEKLKLKALFKSDCSRENFGVLHNAQACRNAIVLFVILDQHSFRVVESEGFKQLCRQLQPQMTIPSRRTIARDCFQLYLAEKLKLKALFKSDCSRVALTTDCWTSVQNLGYMTLTAHFIDKEWNYQKRIISFSLVSNHKGDTIGRKIEEVLDVSTRWNSTYMMLEAAEKYQAAFDKLESEDSGYLTWFGVAGPPTSDDWERVPSICWIFKDFLWSDKGFFIVATSVPAHSFS